jgi:hypothetical protein
VINAKAKPSVEALASYEALLGSVTHEDMGAVLSPAVEKALRKSPAGVLGAVAALAAQLQLDLSQYVEPLLLGPALRMVKSVEEEPRGHSLALLQTVADKLSDADVLLRVVQEVRGGA